MLNRRFAAVRPAFFRIAIAQGEAWGSLAGGGGWGRRAGGGGAVWSGGLWGGGLWAWAGVGGGLAGASCNPDSTPAVNGRHMQPLSDRMQAEIESKNMAKESPILVRIFKEES